MPTVASLKNIVYDIGVELAHLHAELEQVRKDLKDSESDDMAYAAYLKLADIIRCVETIQDMIGD